MQEVKPLFTVGRVSGVRNDSPNGRTYEWKGETFQSVTSILSKHLPKFGLLPWAVKLVAEEAVSGIRDSSLVYRVSNDPDEALKYLKSIPDTKRDKAADLGSAIHEMLEVADGSEYGADIPSNTPTEIVPFLQQFQAFLREFRPVYIAQECTVFNRELGYAGTLDAIIQDKNGRRLLIDYKTGNNVYPEVALQLAAYRYAEFIGQDGGVELPMIPVEGAAVLHLRPTKYKYTPVDAGPEVFDAFRKVVAVRSWFELEKTVLKVKA